MFTKIGTVELCVPCAAYSKIAYDYANDARKATSKWSVQFEWVRLGMFEQRRNALGTVCTLYFDLIWKRFVAHEKRFSRDLQAFLFYLKATGLNNKKYLWLAFQSPVYTFSVKRMFIQSKWCQFLELKIRSSFELSPIWSGSWLA